jgi:ketosteroid isomerase-like protein
MHKSKLVIGTLVAAALMAVGFGAQASAADTKDEITELEHKCAATTNVDDLMACYTASDDLVVYDLSTPREFDGVKAVRANFQNFFDSFNSEKIEFINLHVIPDGKLAVAASVQHLTAADKSGRPYNAIFRVTDVWRKEKGGWKIVHTHVSFPIDVASGKADQQSK